MCVCVCVNRCACSVRCESAGRDRERSEAAGSKRPGKVYSLINSRRFQQMEVLEGLNLLITISGYTQAYSSISIHLLITVRTHGCMQAVHIYDLSLRQKE